MTRCELCGRLIDPTAKGTHRWASGWERHRTAGEGVFPLKNRIYSDRYAHDLCLEVADRGGDPAEMYKAEAML